MSAHTTPLSIPRFFGEAGAASRGQSVELVALRAPLAAKLIGANLAGVALLGIAWLALRTAEPAIIVLVVVGASALHFIAATIALRPIRELEDVATRLWHGDYGARVGQSAVADHGLVRVGVMLNTLLDELVADRARMRALATEVIEVGDRERAAIARELHDSTAQRLAGLLLEVSAAARDCTDPALAERLLAARDSAEEITEEVRLLSHAVYPHVLDDLGLGPALQKLARDSSRGSGIDIDVDLVAARQRLPGNIAASLYRIAQEAVRNAIRHASPRSVRIVLSSDERSARLEVHDDGRGFDLQDARKRRAGIGLLSMGERMSLADGSLDILTGQGSGTTVIASVPVSAAQEIGVRRYT
ncbi:MAG: histidine kinase dimerization and phosphoacceptor region [Gemmatimonadetes bacterium]|nr:histidine kinase dimerization and phosphoacceptor region [Gemmatimonadota bacterium]